jgi:hypothetical protein
MGLDQAMGQQVQLEVGLWRGAWLGIFCQQRDNQRALAFGKASQ